MKRLVAIALAIGFVIVAAGCGEKPAVTANKDGKYQGKTDTDPWNKDGPFKGDKAAWEKAVKARNDNQNEYVRVSGS